MSGTTETAAPQDVCFYRSFPRHHKHDHDYSIALKTLRSILKNGLLLTAEEFPVPQGFPKPSFPQIRTCFTATHPAAVKAHSKLFGSFSLEFPLDALRAFGAQPAFYLAAPRNEVGLLNTAGAQTALHLLETYELLRRLWNLRDKPQSPAIEEATKTLMPLLWHDKHAFQHLFFALQAILNLYYWTDEPSSRALRFFEQREWKIIPNFVHGGKWHYRALEEAEKRELEEINPHFFTAVVAGKPRVEQCHFFSRIENRQIVDEANRIIVPDEFVSVVSEMVKDALSRGEISKSLPVVAISELPDRPVIISGDADTSPCRS